MIKKYKIFIYLLFSLLSSCGGEFVGSNYVEVPILGDAPKEIRLNVAGDIVKYAKNCGLHQAIKDHFVGISDEQINELELYVGDSLESNPSPVIGVRITYTLDQSKFSYKIDTNKSAEIVIFVGGIIHNLVVNGLNSTSQQGQDKCSVA